jgi:protoporphyrinogen oxidase
MGHDGARQDVDVLVLGGGLAGLSCGQALEGSGLTYRIVEKEADTGGLARTRTRPHGCLFDVTGHWLHVRRPEVRALVDRLLGDVLVPRSRRARVFSHGVYTHYPYQANTFGLPPEVAADCLLGFLRARTHDVLGKDPPPALPPPRTFADFILQRMGEGIARHFMFPYNTKIWTVHPREMDASWCDRFVPVPSVEDVVKGALGLSPEQLGYNATFIYPREGGIQRLPRALAAACTGPVDLGVRPLALDTTARLARLDNGREVAFKHLFTTIPLPDLVPLLHPCPEEVREAARALRWTTLTYLDVAAREPASLAPAPGHATPWVPAESLPHWSYVPEERFPFYRVGSFTAVEPSMAPPGVRTFYVEYNRPAGQGVEVAWAVREAVAGLVAMGLVRSEEDVLFAEPGRVEVAYSVQGAGENHARQVVLDYLRTVGVTSGGRYGAWYYSSMEDAVWDGMEAARRFRLGSG